VVNLPDIGQRILMLLLHNNDITPQEIADSIGSSLRKVAYGSTHRDASQLDSLIVDRIKDTDPKVIKHYIELLIAVIDKEPQDYGYEFGTWTFQRLASHLEKEKGLTYHENAAKCTQYPVFESVELTVMLMA